MNLTRDIIYGHSHATALTFDVLTPTTDANGAAVVFVVSGGWISATGTDVSLAAPLVNRGYTVFAVSHGAQPKYTIPEIVPQISRAVSFIRAHAREYGVDPERIGIMGISSGGHLTLMQATRPLEPDPNAADPVDRVSARVQAAACFFAPTDFLNYGGPGNVQLGTGDLAGLAAAFDFHEFSQGEHKLVRITDEARRIAIARDISPIYHVSDQTPPILIFHGDADKIVPIQQAQTFAKHCEEAGVPATLHVKPGAGHGWPELVTTDLRTIADFFDLHLACPDRTPKVQ
jgi:acetyl esterase/lipase